MTSDKFSITSSTLHVSSVWAPSPPVDSVKDGKAVHNAALCCEEARLVSTCVIRRTLSFEALFATRLHPWSEASMAPNSFFLSTRLSLANSLSIPQIQLGVYLMSGKEATNAVRFALQTGYRGIDSAQMYHNEADCGKAIKAFLEDKSQNTQGLTREDIFFTSKLASNASVSPPSR